MTSFCTTVLGKSGIKSSLYKKNPVIAHTYRLRAYSPPSLLCTKTKGQYNTYLGPAHFNCSIDSERWSGIFYQFRISILTDLQVDLEVDPEFWKGEGGGGGGLSEY